MLRLWLWRIYDLKNVVPRIMRAHEYAQQARHYKIMNKPPKFDIEPYLKKIKESDDKTT